MKNFTIGYRHRFPEVFEKYLGPCLQALEGEFNVMFASGGLISDCNDFRAATMPAQNYNDMIDACETPYLALVHEDITFTPDLIYRLQDTIDRVPDFGALGLVGCDAGGVNRWSKTEKIYEVDTLDSCFIVVRKDLPVRFDAETFNELHLYVEDFCGQIHNIGRKVYTITQPEGSHIDHHSTTWNKLGGCWGNWAKYKTIFSQKYPNLKTT